MAKQAGPCQESTLLPPSFRSLEFPSSYRGATPGWRLLVGMIEVAVTTASASKEPVVATMGGRAISARHCLCFQSAMAVGSKTS